MYSDSYYLVVADLGNSPEVVERKEGSWQLHHLKELPFFLPPPYPEASKFAFLCQLIPKF